MWSCSGKFIFKQDLFSQKLFCVTSYSLPISMHRLKQFFQLPNKFSPLFSKSLTWIFNRKESELAAVGSRRMLFPNCGGIAGSQDTPTSRGPPGVADLGLGLQSLRLSGWDRPWSSQDTDAHSSPSQVQTSSPSSKYHCSCLPRWIKEMMEKPANMFLNNPCQREVGGFPNSL